MSKHTPGPWKVRVTRFFNVPDSGQYLVVGTDAESICRMTASEGPEMQEQAMPDARLIAAAPEMLEALEAAFQLIPSLSVVQWPPGHALKRETQEKVRKAILKAKGVRDE